MSSVFYIWLLIRVLTCIISDYYIKYHIARFKDRVDKHAESPVCQLYTMLSCLWS